MWPFRSKPLPKPSVPTPNHPELDAQIENMRALNKQVEALTEQVREIADQGHPRIRELEDALDAALTENEQLRAKLSEPCAFCGKTPT